MRLSAKAPIVIRGEEITHLDADGYKHLPRATSLPDGKVLATSGGKWGASDLSGVSVASVFGRTGAVAAQTGDYTAAQVGAEPYAGAPAQTSFWRSTAAGVRAWVQLVAADITDLATVLAGYLTKANPDFTGALKQGGTTRIASGGGAWLTSMQSANLVGAGDRPVAADLTGTLQPKTPDQFRNMIFALASSLKGAANGVAELGADVKVPVAQLPSAALLALGADSTTAHRGDHGTTAYTHSQIATGNPHGTTAAQVGAAKASHVHSADDITSGTLPTSRGGTGNESLPSGFLVSTNQRVQSIGLTNNTVPFFSGTTQGFWNLQFGSEFSFSSGSDPVLSLAGIAWSKVSKTGAVAADVGAAKAPSKVDISASTTIGSIDATAIKVTTTDVNLTLSGGVNGQGWDIVCPTTSFGISIPAGVTLYAYAGSNIGPTTRAVGGGRGIRIVRIDAATWIAPNLTW